MKEKVCDTVSQSQKGRVMDFTIIKAVGWKHPHPPIRAEPAVGEKQPVAQLHENKIKRKGKTK